MQMLRFLTFFINKKAPVFNIMALLVNI